MKSTKTPLFIIGAVIVIAIVGIVAYALAQNGHDTTTSHHEHSEGNQTDQTDAVKTDEVEIEDYAFSPATITVKAGSKVTWTNKDDVGHTVTSDDGAPAAIESGLFGKGESFSFTFTKAGTYRYHCQPHPYMKGTVVVIE